MRLTNTAILIIRGMTPEQKEALAEALGVSTRTLYRYLDSNDDCLTKAASLKFIKDITGLEDSALVEDTEDSLATKEEQN